MPESHVERWHSIADFLAEWLQEDRLEREEQAVLDEYYKSYRAHFGAYIRQHYADQTAEAIALLQQGRRRLLEVGAGCGTEALWFAIQGASVISIDVKEERLRVARARQAFVENQLGRELDVEFRRQSLLDLEETDRFDIVWMEQTFHHLEPREPVYACVARALASGGHLIISEANGWNPLLQAKLFAARGFRTIVHKRLADGTVHPYGNERITIPHVVAKGFRRVGIEPVSVRFYRMLPNRAWSDRLVNVETAIPSLLKRPICTHYNFVGRKRVQ
jgi:SAM-dependent methyltransferase